MNRIGPLVALLASSATAAAEPARVDWSRGLVIAEAVGIANRHAPNPAVARGTSRRGAEDAARKQLAARLADLPIAGGGKVADASKDRAVKDRLAKAVDAAITLAAEPETDGAWQVTMAVPLEAIRQALAGPRELPADGDKGPPVIIVDGVSAKPALAWKVGTVEPPTLWVTTVPDWAKSAPHVKAKRAKAGVIEVEGIDATAATLFVIVTPPG
jgi:hypothetical protein